MAINFLKEIKKKKEGKKIMTWLNENMINLMKNNWNEFLLAHNFENIF